MTNPKRKKFSEALDNISKEKFGNENFLSSDLAERVGNLADRTKITIRLDVRVIEAAKQLDEKLGGVGYQKIINDRLLAAFGLQNETTFQEVETHSVKMLLDEVMEVKSRLNKLEQKLA